MHQYVVLISLYNSGLSDNESEFESDGFLGAPDSNVTKSILKHTAYTVTVGDISVPHNKNCCVEVQQ